MLSKCPTCLKEFVPKKYTLKSRKQKYCSAECSRTVYKEFGDRLKALKNKISYKVEVPWFCTGCKKTKDTTEFRVKKNGKRNTHCLDCMSKNRGNRYSNY